MNDRNDSKRLPAVFISHGSPMAALEAGEYAQSLRRFGSSVNPKAILVVSAHWETPDVRITAAENPQLVYDFGGFPRELYEMKYDAPGSPELARRVRDLLANEGVDVKLDASRGWDHGVWIPMRLTFPDARISVVALSLPIMEPAKLFAIGRALRSLRDEGVLIVGSGGIVHNLRLFNPRVGKDAAPESWAIDFTNWVMEGIEQHHIDELFAYEAKAPHAQRAVPTPEHFTPLFVVLGAAGDYDSVDPIFYGFDYGHMAMHSFAIA
jgi:4,5-DOPA dioxygenase extradiol